MRAKEIGLHRVNCATQRRLIFKFLEESFVMTVFAMVLALILANLLMLLFSSVSGSSTRASG